MAGGTQNRKHRRGYMTILIESFTSPATQRPRRPTINIQTTSINSGMVSRRSGKVLYGSTHLTTTLRDGYRRCGSLHRTVVRWSYLFLCGRTWIGFKQSQFTLTSGCSASARHSPDTRGSHHLTSWLWCSRRSPSTATDDCTSLSNISTIQQRSGGTRSGLHKKIDLMASFVGISARNERSLQSHGSSNIRNAFAKEFSDSVQATLFP